MLPGIKLITFPLSCNTGHAQLVGGGFKVLGNPADRLEDGKGSNVAFVVSLRGVCQFTGVISFISYLAVE